MYSKQQLVCKFDKVERFASRLFLCLRKYNCVFHFIAPMITPQALYTAAIFAEHTGSHKVGPNTTTVAQ